MEPHTVTPPSKEARGPQQERRAEGLLDCGVTRSAVDDVSCSLTNREMRLMFTSLERRRVPEPLAHYGSTR
ncbi:hypothetical protein EYF80_057153 [Liparis tanakae]|uniref:Uncharacterized protein n=1 Tax=Liparis tanakae TaxID=230148 RepID=A0A4Z2EV66_9TELE|nr:hypothetical protein EYF80_057153 [Liparis tanakae]